jgi:hypothetical protein
MADKRPFREVYTPNSGLERNCVPHPVASASAFLFNDKLSRPLMATTTSMMAA